MHIRKYSNDSQKRPHKGDDGQRRATRYGKVVGE